MELVKKELGKTTRILWDMGVYRNSKVGNHTPTLRKMYHILWHLIDRMIQTNMYNVTTKGWRLWKNLK